MGNKSTKSSYNLPKSQSDLPAPQRRDKTRLKSAKRPSSELYTKHEAYGIMHDDDEVTLKTVKRRTVSDMNITSAHMPSSSSSATITTKTSLNTLKRSHPRQHKASFINFFIRKFHLSSTHSVHVLGTGSDNNSDTKFRCLPASATEPNIGNTNRDIDEEIAASNNDNDIIDLYDEYDDNIATKPRFGRMRPSPPIDDFKKVVDDNVKIDELFAKRETIYEEDEIGDEYTLDVNNNREAAVVPVLPTSATQTSTPLKLLNEVNEKLRDKMETRVSHHFIFDSNDYENDADCSSYFLCSKSTLDLRTRSSRRNREVNSRGSVVSSASSGIISQLSYLDSPPLASSETLTSLSTSTPKQPLVAPTRKFKSLKALDDMTNIYQLSEYTSASASSSDRTHNFLCSTSVSQPTLLLTPLNKLSQPVNKLN